MDFQCPKFEIVLTEEERKNSELAYADHMMKWGKLLLELSIYQDALEDIKKMDLDAISKLEEALSVNPKKHEALSLLGNAYSSVAFLTGNLDEAKLHFEKSAECYRRARDLDPTNEQYRKAVDMVKMSQNLYYESYKNTRNARARVPGPSISSPSSSLSQRLHLEAVKNMRDAGALVPGHSNSIPWPSSSQPESAPKKRSDPEYNIFGWILLGVGIVAWVGFAKSLISPSAPLR